MTPLSEPGIVPQVGLSTTTIVFIAEAQRRREVATADFADCADENTKRKFFSLSAQSAVASSFYTLRLRASAAS
jgi:hypothetical protein